MVPQIYISNVSNVFQMFEVAQKHVMFTQKKRSIAISGYDPYLDNLMIGINDTYIHTSHRSFRIFLDTITTNHCFF